MIQGLILKRCIILIPSLIPSGPVKGALALANGLAQLGVSVILISLRSGTGINSLVDSKVNLINLGYTSNLSIFFMIRRIRHIISKSRIKEQSKMPIISSCFSADFVNLFCQKSTLRISSIRGDLEVNYSMDNRYFGKLIAKIHYFIVKNFDLSFALNKEMKSALIKKNFKKVVLVPNFLNERDLIPYQKKKENSSNINLIFVGSLSERKKPHLLIDTVAKLNRKGYSFNLKIIGSGPLYKNLFNLIDELNDKKIELLGFCERPMTYLKEADIFILPSVSEGTPRAVMEALFIGLPCIMRNLGTNDNLVVEGINGAIFEKDKDLEDAILRTADLRLRLNKNKNLLDSSFSQLECSRTIMEEIELFL